MLVQKQFLLYLFIVMAMLGVSGVPFFLKPFYNCCGAYQASDLLGDTELKKHCSHILPSIRKFCKGNIQLRCDEFYGDICLDCDYYHYKRLCCGVEYVNSAGFKVEAPDNCNTICCNCQHGCKGLPTGQFTG